MAAAAVEPVNNGKVLSRRALRADVEGLTPNERKIPSKGCNWPTGQAGKGKECQKNRPLNTFHLNIIIFI
ncbi:MAG: hypothetical protein CVU88_06550 [Firmicutes bacterium HGW-Firmicutes-13]|nr:MAG: hypothetical protein CVU88_06550 [Firmicutes bacterium HGW-Firmicutes-13]